MEALNCIRTRRSRRKFLESPIEFDKLMQVIDAGHHAPSSGNIQNWRFIILTDKKLIHSLPQHCLGQEWADAPVVIVACANTEVCDRHYGIRGSRLYSVQNIAAAVENMLLAAHALGLGAVWIGAFDEERIGQLCGVPESARPQALISLGYPDEEPARKVLKPLEDVVFFNKYGNKVKAPHLEVRDYSDEIAARVDDVRDMMKSAKIRDKFNKVLNKKSRLPKDF